jgi:hypothetical protein
MLQTLVCVSFQYLMMKQFMLPVLQRPTPPWGLPGPAGVFVAFTFDMMRVIRCPLA